MKDKLKSPSLALLQPSAESEGKGRRNSGGSVQWTTKGQRSRGDDCGMKHDPEKRRESKRNGKVMVREPSNSPRRNSADRGFPTRNRASREEKVFEAGDCPKRNACDYWHPPPFSFIKKKIATLEKVCVHA